VISAAVMVPGRVKVAISQAQRTVRQRS
jgi:hypothetical protein